MDQHHHQVPNMCFDTCAKSFTFIVCQGFGQNLVKELACFFAGSILITFEVSYIFFDPA